MVRDDPSDGTSIVEHAQIGTRLGEGLRERGSFAPAAIRRTLDAVRTFAERSRQLDASLACIATSAVRRADDADAFAALVFDIAGAPLEVIDGRLEAEASYRGATHGAALGDERVAVLDIGGGSTECAVGSRGIVDAARSLELGSVRIGERYPELLGGCPGTAARSAARRAREEVAAAVAPLRDFRPVGHVRCVAGTPMTMAAVASGTHVDRVSGTVLTLVELDATIDRLLDATLEERRAMPGMLAQRADILPAGAIVLSESLRALDVSSGLLESNDLLLGFLLLRGAAAGAIRPDARTE